MEHPTEEYILLREEAEGASIDIGSVIGILKGDISVRVEDESEQKYVISVPECQTGRLEEVLEGQGFRSGDDYAPGLGRKEFVYHPSYRGFQVASD